MPAIIIWRKQEIEINAPVSVKDALEQLNLTAESYLVLCNGELITEDRILQDGEIAKLIPVMVGG